MDAHDVIPGRGFGIAELREHRVDPVPADLAKKARRACEECPQSALRTAQWPKTEWNMSNEIRSATFIGLGATSPTNRVGRSLGAVARSAHGAPSRVDIVLELLAIVGHMGECVRHAAIDPQNLPGDKAALV